MFESITPCDHTARDVRIGNTGQVSAGAGTKAIDEFNRPDQIDAKCFIHRASPLARSERVSVLNFKMVVRQCGHYFREVSCA